MGCRFAIALLFLGFHSAVGGCVYRDLPVEMGPEIPLGEVPGRYSTASTTVRMDDARPDWERKYYAGSQSSLQHEWGMTFWPMESFQPDLERHLQWQVTTLSEDFSEKPSAVSVKLTSFRAILNRIENQQEKIQPILPQRDDDHDTYRRDRKDLEKFNKRYHTLKEEYRDHPELLRALDSSLIDTKKSVDYQARSERIEEHERNGGENIASLFLQGLLSHGLPASIIALTELPNLKPPVSVKDGKKLLVRPPEEIRTEQYGPGLTCEIEGRVTFDWKDGTSSSFSVLGWNYASRPGARLNFDLEDVSGSVRSAIRVLGYDLQGQLAKKFDEELAAGSTIGYSAN